MDWKQSWTYLASWGVTLGAIIVAMRQTFAAERDREALKNVNLEREKLELEVNRLRNSPEAVKDRRELYDKLRQLVQIIGRRGSTSYEEISALQELKHDSAYRFPAHIADSIQNLIEEAGTLLWSGDNMQRGREMVSYEEWEKLVKTNSNAKLEVVEFEHAMVDLFKPYLTL